MFEEDLPGVGGAATLDDDADTAGAVRDPPVVGAVKDVEAADWDMMVGETDAVEAVVPIDDGVLTPEVDEGVPVPAEVVEGTDIVMGIAIVATVTGRVTGRGVPGLVL